MKSSIFTQIEAQCCVELDKVARTKVILCIPYHQEYIIHTIRTHYFVQCVLWGYSKLDTLSNGVCYVLLMLPFRFVGVYF